VTDHCLIRLTYSVSFFASERGDNPMTSDERWAVVGSYQAFLLSPPFPQAPKMKTSRLFAILTALSLTGISCAAEEAYDIVVYGATGGGVTAAVEAGRLGKSVALIEPLKHIGGMTAGGLGATDIGAKTSVIGLAREFYHRVWQHYQDPATWIYETRAEYKPKHHDAISDNLETHWFFEPKVADKILTSMLSEAGVKIFTGERLRREAGGVKKDGNRIVSITTESGKTFDGKVFIDASYEGDLMACAGVSHFVGREANSQHGETLNGTRPRFPINEKPIDPYKVPGDRASGLLPNIEPAPPQEVGATDKRVQAYTFRLCLTDAPENRMPVTKPASYDSLVYEPHLRWILANPKAAVPGKTLFKLTPMPNRKTDSNNHGPFSTDFVSRSAEWAEASYAQREQMWQEHAGYVRGFFWFLGNDLRVPESVRTETLRWGLPKDEFTDSGGWPFQLYVREARRMTSDYIVTEDDCRRNRIAPDGVVLASYSMDSHATSRFVDQDGGLRIEGSFLVKVSPYPVSYRAIVPKEKECGNLLVPVCLSASHAAYGSIRMEPVFMMLGQASAFAASAAIDGNQTVQSIPAEKIRAHLGAAALIGAIKPASAADEKPAASPAASSTKAPFNEAVARLKKAQILEGDLLWLESIKSGQNIDGAKVGQFLVSFASRTKPATNVEEALDTLASAKIFPDSKGYWRANARPGKTCPASQVMQLTIRFANTLPKS